MERNKNIVSVVWFEYSKQCTIVYISSRVHTPDELIFSYKKIQWVVHNGPFNAQYIFSVNIRLRKKNDPML